MTWSISTSGTREELKARMSTEFRRQVADGHMTADQAEVVVSAVASLPGDRLHLNCSGYNSEHGSSMSISCSAYPEKPGDVTGESNVAIKIGGG